MNYIGKFSSVAEFAAYIKGGNTQACFDGRHENVSEWSSARQREFAGLSLDESYEMLEKGDVNGAAKIKAEGDIIARKQGTGAPSFESAVVGCVPCVPNYLRGVPKAMLKIDRHYPKKPVIDVYVDTAIWAGINLDRLAQSAANVANVIAAVERAGVRVNLYAMCACKRNNSHAVAIVRIKDSRAPLNLLNVAFALTNRAFCRMCFLRWQAVAMSEVFNNNGSVMSGSEVQSIFGIKGVLLSIPDIVRCGTSIESLSQTFNAYIQAQA